MEVNSPQEGHAHRGVVSAISGFRCYHFMFTERKEKSKPQQNVTIDSTAIHPNCSVSRELSLDAAISSSVKTKIFQDPQTTGLHELKSQFCCGTTTTTSTTTMMMVRGALDQLVHHQWTCTDLGQGSTPFRRSDGSHDLNSFPERSNLDLAGPVFMEYSKKTRVKAVDDVFLCISNNQFSNRPMSSKFHGKRLHHLQ